MHSGAMTTPHTPNTDLNQQPVPPSPPTVMATRNLQDYIFQNKDHLPSKEYKEMLDDCGKLYDLEMSHTDFAKRLSSLSSATPQSTPSHVSKQLHDIHILNQHIMQARRCSMKFKFFLKRCRSIENISWNSKVYFEGQKDTMKCIFKEIVNKYKFHHREARNILKQNADSKIIKQLLSLRENLYFLIKSMSK